LRIVMDGRSLTFILLRARSKPTPEEAYHDES
jgi:hypothetical protein